MSLNISSSKIYILLHFILLQSKTYIQGKYRNLKNFSFRTPFPKLFSPYVSSPSIPKLLSTSSQTKDSFDLPNRCQSFTKNSSNDHRNNSCDKVVRSFPCTLRYFVLSREWFVPLEVAPDKTSRYANVGPADPCRPLSTVTDGTRKRATFISPLAAASRQKVQLVSLLSLAVRR